jgi:hypothetical protein
MHQPRRATSPGREQGEFLCRRDLPSAKREGRVLIDCDGDLPAKLLSADGCRVQQPGGHRRDPWPHGELPRTVLTVRSVLSRADHRPDGILLR